MIQRWVLWQFAFNWILGWIYIIWDVQWIKIVCSVLGVEWGLLFPAANGEYQSPINLNSREAKYDPSLLEARLSPNYVVCRDSEVINDGHTVKILLKSKSGM